MSFHQPILPGTAIELVKSRNMANAESFLADFAAAGLVKTYALMREIRTVGRPTMTVRDAQIPQEEWVRIIASKNVGTALNGGTVRLEGATSPGGLSNIQITGISFSEASLAKVLDRYCGAPAQASALHPEAGNACSNGELPRSFESQSREPKEVRPIEVGDLTASIAQTMKATGLGRTKVNQLIKKGDLVKTKVGYRTLITVEIIERSVGATVTN
ncbi:MAG: hypothetical protein CL574_02095 [Altererythrobacter sp.]|nr:hypothetical protein [Altererythrobacter sp.]|tara:strand:+ start:658 stop:1305 length:648 start_codon:yes stop_codon:yes gene_type:complete